MITFCYRCLLKDRVLHYRPKTASKIILACAVLHNLAIHFNGNEEIEELHDEMDQMPPEPLPVNEAEYRREGTLARQVYVNTYFQ